MSPVVRSVLINHIELQRLRSKRDVPTGVVISGVTDEGTVAAKELCVTARIQVSTEARARPLTKRPRVQCTDIVRQRLAILAKNADVAPVHVDVLGVEATVLPSSLLVGTCELAELVFRHNSTALVGVAVDTLPAQLELTVRAGGGGQGFCNPGFWIRCYLLVNPALQALLILNSPALTTQGLAREVALRVLLNLLHRVIGEVRANNLHASGRNVLATKGAHGVVVQSALQHVKVPESSTSVGTTVATSAGAFHPFVLWEMLRQFVLLGVLDGHAGDLVAAPLSITLGGRRRVCADAREDTRCRLVHQPVLIRQVLRKLRPYTDLLAILIPAPVATVGGTNGCVRTELTRHTKRIGVRRHLDGEITVFITLGVVHRRGMLSVLTLVPLGVDLHTRNGLSGALDLTKTNLGLNNLLHRTGDRALLVRLTRGVNSLIATRCRSLSCRLILLRIRNRGVRGSRGYRLSKRRHQGERKRCCRNRGPATARNMILLHFVKSSFHEEFWDTGKAHISACLPATHSAGSHAARTFTLVNIVKITCPTSSHFPDCFHHIRTSQYAGSPSSQAPHTPPLLAKHHSASTKERPSVRISP